MSDQFISSTIDLQPHVEYREILDIPGYRIGNDGTVWSCWARVPGGTGGETYLSKEWKKLKLYNHKGYNRATIYVNKKRRQFYIGSLLLLAFVGPPPQKRMIACHFPDPNPGNNSISNLRWGTYQDNMDHRDIHGNTAKGERQHLSKLKENDIRKIRLLLDEGKSCVEVSKIFNVYWSTIGKIRRGDTWKHVI